MKLSDVVWTDDDGKVISCAEKNKVLKENLGEIRQVSTHEGCAIRRRARVKQLPT